MTSKQELATFFGLCLAVQFIASPVELNNNVRIVPRELPPAVEPRAPNTTAAFLTDNDIRIDGDLSDWPEIELIAIASRESFVGEVWSGPDDLSVAVRLTYDLDDLYIGCEVTDNHFSQPYGEGDIWQGDSLQIALDPLRDGQGQGYGPDDYEFGFALVDGAPIVWRWEAKLREDRGRVRAGETAIQRRGAVTIYEIRFPFSALQPLLPYPGAACGFSVLVNDLDPQEQRAYMEWTPGIGAEKDPSLFGDLVFAAERMPGSRSAIGSLMFQQIFGSEKEPWEVDLLVAAGASVDLTVTAEAIRADQVVDREKKSVLVPGGTNAYDIFITPGEIPPGKYELRLSIRDQDGNLVCQRGHHVYRYKPYEPVEN